MPLSPERKGRVGVLQSILFKTSLLCLATHPQSSIYSLTLRSESRVAGFCKRSVKCTDGNNLTVASNPEDGCFYSLDFLWCQRRPCSPESLPADCNCCQRFMTFCISGFLIANWNILDSWAQERFPSCFFLPPRKDPGSPFHSPEIWSCSFPECVQINPNVIGFYLQTAFLPRLLGQCSHTCLSWWTACLDKYDNA